MSIGAHQEHRTADVAGRWWAGAGQAGERPKVNHPCQVCSSRSLSGMCSVAATGSDIALLLVFLTMERLPAQADAGGLQRCEPDCFALSGGPSLTILRRGVQVTRPSVPPWRAESPTWEGPVAGVRTRASRLARCVASERQDDGSARRIPAVDEPFSRSLSLKLSGQFS
jgi:hypothetical protein